jgi:hypothetical protein
MDGPSLLSLLLLAFRSISVVAMRLSKRNPDGAERNPGRRRIAAIPDYAPLHPGYGAYVVTAGLDPAVHADWPNVRLGPMDCRIKSGNDEALDDVMPGLVPGIHVLTAAKKDVDGRPRQSIPFGTCRR